MVRWATKGGTLLTYPDRHLMIDPDTPTDKYGQAGAYLRADLEGILEVTATVVEVGLSASFRIVSTSPANRLISFGPFLCDRTPSTFYDPELHADSSVVKVGAVVTFALYIEDFDGFQCRAKLRSVQFPEGGDSFDTDTIQAGERVRFTPNVAGTWIIEDVVNGGRFSLTARNP